MLNSWLLAESMPLERDTGSLWVPPAQEDARSPLYATVAYTGDAVTEYHNPAQQSDHNLELQQGDKVLFLPDSDVPMQYDFHRSLDGGKMYYRMQRKDILGIVEPQPSSI